MVEDWTEFTTKLSGDLRNLRTGAPDVMKGFSVVWVLAENVDIGFLRSFQVTLLMQGERLLELLVAPLDGQADHGS